jgi:hypothetical protein
MTFLAVMGEGQTEERCVNTVLLVPLAEKNVMAHARLIPTSKYSSGGALRRDRVLLNLRNTLRERDNLFVTTFFDLYGLPSDFPGVAESKGIADPIQRARAIEQALAEAAIAAAGCRPEKFIPHIQPHEFESILFSDVDRFAQVESVWASRIDSLRDTRNAVASPEHINGGKTTHPAAHLDHCLQSPSFSKVLHGTRVAEAIGLAKIREECQHFGSWFSTIEALKPF